MDTNRELLQFLKHWNFVSQGRKWRILEQKVQKQITLKDDGEKLQIKSEIHSCPIFKVPGSIFLSWAVCKQLLFLENEFYLVWRIYSLMWLLTRVP